MGYESLNIDTIHVPCRTGLEVDHVHPFSMYFVLDALLVLFSSSSIEKLTVHSGLYFRMARWVVYQSQLPTKVSLL